MKMDTKIRIFQLSSLVLISLAFHVSGEEIGSPLKVAQCRASCVYSFSKKNESSILCMRNEDCLSCWKSCQQLQSSFNKLCSQNVHCGPGCAVACKFMDSGSDAQRTPVLVKRGEEVLMVDGQETRWPAQAPDQGPWVYLVMRRQNNAWRQITQTLELSAKIPAGGMVRVLVVGRDGLTTIYGPAEESGLTEDEGWNLREVSVIHQEAVVIAEVAWEPIHPQALYLVTWEVGGGGLRGNLLTYSTCVALSLWPDTLFQVQVELMTPGVTVPEKSEELVIDTHKSREEGLILPEEKYEEFTTLSTSELENEILNKYQDQNDRNILLTDEDIEIDAGISQHRISKQPLILTEDQLKALAVVSAALAIMIVCVLWIRYMLRSSSHVKLIEDDFINTDLFQVVTHDNKDQSKQNLLSASQDIVT